MIDLNLSTFQLYISQDNYYVKLLIFKTIYETTSRQTNDTECSTLLSKWDSIHDYSYWRHGQE